MSAKTALRVTAKTKPEHLTACVSTWRSASTATAAKRA